MSEEINRVDVLTVQNLLKKCQTSHNTKFIGNYRILQNQGVRQCPKLQQNG